MGYGCPRACRVMSFDPLPQWTWLLPASVIWKQRCLWQWWRLPHCTQWIPSWARCKRSWPIGHIRPSRVYLYTAWPLFSSMELTSAFSQGDWQTDKAGLWHSVGFSMEFNCKLGTYAAWFLSWTTDWGRTSTEVIEVPIERHWSLTVGSVFTVMSTRELERSKLL